MTKLPQYLAECPDHVWNQKAQLFEARLFYTQENGQRVYTDTFSIQPHVFAAIMADMKTAYAAFEADTKSAQVIPMKKAEG